MLAPIAAILALMAPASAAETLLSVNYGISAAGFPVGKAVLKFQLNGERYTVSGFGRTSGIVKLISDGRGKVTAAGALNAGRPVPAAFTYDATDDGGRETVNMTFSGDRVGTIDQQPPKNPKWRKHYVPLEHAHKVGVLDPLSALFIPAGADTVCNRTLPIFDGEQRFDLVLSKKRIDRFQGGKENYKGKVVVCAVSYRPIAGHRRKKKEVKEMQNNSSMELWMAPFGDTGLMAPVTGQLSTSIGPVVIRATRFWLK